mmetsp:Transcript_8336/g.18194  ORF Transcript_8336/g.18194 Transcript_8336/m.18194 type:complete len:214 (+) Transcript_8336:885-1526(+)
MQKIRHLRGGRPGRRPRPALRTAAKDEAVPPHRRLRPGRCRRAPRPRSSHGAPDPGSVAAELRSGSARRQAGGDPGEGGRLRRRGPAAGGRLRRLGGHAAVCRSDPGERHRGEFRGGQVYLGTKLRVSGGHVRGRGRAADVRGGGVSEKRARVRTGRLLLRRYASGGGREGFRTSERVAAGVVLPAAVSRLCGCRGRPLGSFRGRHYKNFDNG